MDINTFLKAYTLFRNKTGNEDIKDTGVIVSNINGNNTITELNWLSMCEWRALKNGVLDVADKNSKITWSAIAALEEDAKKVADFSN